jgi:acetylornithine deacetylase/succinyl-diaminopimelate desuccinylase-like protein
MGMTAWLQDATYRPRAAIPTAGMAKIASRDEVSRALARVDADGERIVDAWVRLASTPASSRHEDRRAALVEDLLRAAGLREIRRDRAGNVVGVLPGRDRDAPKVVFMAHMDTVAQPGAEFTISREEGILRGPGVRDNSSGLSGLLTAARIAREAGIEPPADVLVVASVEEEIGLNGSKAFLEESGDQVGAFVAVDGYLGEISYAATSIFWTRMHFGAPGAHTLRSYQHPSATLAVAKAIEGIYEIELRRHPEELESWINIGMLGGGEVPNAQARDAWFTVDLRTNDPASAERLKKRILEICEGAAREVGVSFDHEILQELRGAKIPRHARSRIVQASRAALAHLEWGEIRLGVTTGEGAHTPDEHADIEPFSTGVKQLILLMAAGLY